MAASVVLGQRVQLRADSYFAGKSPNPPAGAIGTVMLLDNDWVDVLWDGFTVEYNYRVTELDWYGAPPTNSGEWDWAQAFQDAKNQPVATILDRINQFSPNYDQPFAVMYRMFVQSGQIVDRMTVVQLMPLISAGDKDSVSWNAQGVSPAGTLSVSSVYTNSPTYSCWKITDSSLSTYWYPAANQFRNSFWEISFDTPCLFSKAEMIFSNGGYRPTQIRVEVSNDGVVYSAIGTFNISPNTGTTPSVETLTFSSGGFYKRVKFVCIDIVNPSGVGYGVYDFKLYGVVN